MPATIQPRTVRARDAIERIRIRNTANRLYVWGTSQRRRARGLWIQQLRVTRECVAEAERQGVPIIGRQHRGVLQSRPDVHLAVHRGAGGLWFWRLRDTRGGLVDRSPHAFLTRAECQADAAERGLGRKR
jgi:hypothetical protein